MQMHVLGARVALAAKHRQAALLSAVTCVSRRARSQDPAERDSSTTAPVRGHAENKPATLHTHNKQPSSGKGCRSEHMHASLRRRQRRPAQQGLCLSGRLARINAARMTSAASTGGWLSWACLLFMHPKSQPSNLVLPKNPKPKPPQMPLTHCRKSKRGLMEVKTQVCCVAKVNGGQVILQEKHRGKAKKKQSSLLMMMYTTNTQGLSLSDSRDCCTTATSKTTAISSARHHSTSRHTSGIGYTNDIIKDLGNPKTLLSRQAHTHGS